MAAKSRASEMEHKGAISKATERKIDSKADRKLNANRTADRVVARMSKSRPVR